MFQMMNDTESEPHSDYLQIYLLIIQIKFNCGFPVHSSSLNFFLSFTNKSLPSIIIQAQRDLFGMHGLNFKKESEINNFNHQW